MVFARVGTVRVEVRDRVAHVTLNRPQQGNALTQEMHEELARTWQWINDNEDVWVVCLRGAGADFCVGDDLEEIAHAYRQGGTVKRWRLDDSWERKYAGHAPVYGWPEPTRGLPGKPLVTVVHGRCHGAGLMFVAHADFALAATDAEFSLPQVHQGMAPVIETLSIVNGMMRAPVLRLALLGKHERWSAERARQLGFLYEAHAPERLDERVGQVLEVLTTKSSPLCVRGAKAGYWGTIDLPQPLASRLDHLYKAEVRTASEDSKEGPRAFAEKRRANWKAR
jgi:enoyl-CoA hydratase/carnithine racemase